MSCRRADVIIGRVARQITLQVAFDDFRSLRLMLGYCDSMLVATFVDRECPSTHILTDENSKLLPQSRREPLPEVKLSIERGRVAQPSAVGI